ncbi:MAG: sigma-54 dependent transcriptional regulator [Marinilabiliaceae bacterium]|jgi:DNA-binding NtrC family response regulator|nr:sigma-54 dependent transcriptional regulator [Marinilabiliaceae bacterium]
MEKGKILIVDDNINVLTALVQLLEPEFERVISMDDPEQIPGVLQLEDIDVVLLDMNFDQGISSGEEGIYWLEKILAKDPDIVVVLITAYGSINLAIECIKKGALDFLLKPWDNDKLLVTLKSGLELRQSRKMVKSLREKQLHLNEMLLERDSAFIGSSDQLKEIRKIIARIASSDSTVLILGENGTGKELVAREIHKQSDRRDEVFVHVDIGAVPDTLFESELFGHVKGAYTDASRDRAGRFELASGGTIFLDEIGNLTPALQAKLLYVIQNREVTRLGSNKALKIDARIICATNNDLATMISENRFREDLYYRINTIEILIPPLRERRDDILILADNFLEEFRKKYSREDIYFSGLFREYLVGQHWPGNVRQLRSCIERAVLLSESSAIFPEGSSPVALKTGGVKEKSRSLQEIEKEILNEVLKRNKGNIKKTAEELGIARSTVYNKLRLK